MYNKEYDQTLVLIKPDALRNSLTGYVLSLLSEFHSGLRFAGIKVVHVNTMLAEEHYAEHRGKVFFPALIEYITGKSHYPQDPQKQRVIAIVYQGTDAVAKIRDIAGPTNPHSAREQRPGCIRSLGTVVQLKNAAGEIIGQRLDNLIHASASNDEAEHEIKLWFKPNDIPPSMRVYATKQSEEYFYYKAHKLFTSHKQDTIAISSPGDVMWESDLNALALISQGKPAPITLQSVVAKYLINDTREG